MSDIKLVVESVIRKRGLTPEERNKAIKALVRYRQSGAINSQCPRSVNQALTWSETEEGIDFWSRIDHCL